jgi:hypothetical protein
MYFFVELAALLVSSSLSFVVSLLCKYPNPIDNPP